jgi:hypothetical protein
MGSNYDRAEQLLQRKSQSGSFEASLIAASFTASLTFLSVAIFRS